MLRVMDRLRVLAETEGYFTRPDALGSRSRRQVRPAGTQSRALGADPNGVYTFSDLHAVSDELSWHRSAARALARKSADRVALSHTSAAIEHGLLAHGPI